MLERCTPSTASPRPAFTLFERKRAPVSGIESLLDLPGPLDRRDA
jgi:hypothetical protein